MEKFANITVLVIEPRQNMRVQIRSMLDGIAISRVQFASSSASAIRKLRDESVDLILCARNLGEGHQDGQHLLEDLRTHALIGRQTLFFILSDAPQQEEVISTADLSPDGFLVKPFSAHLLQTRLSHALNRRERFMPLFRALAAGKTDFAIDYCQQAEIRHPRHRTDFMRERAELYLQEGMAEEALTLYTDIAAAPSAPPWARLGIIRSLTALKRLNEALAQLTPLLAEHPLFLSASDCLTLIFEAQQNLVAARQTLNGIIELAPSRTQRLREYARLSILMDDLPSAENALAKVINLSRYSTFRDPQDHLRLLNVQLQERRLADADSTLHDLEKSFGEHPLHLLCRTLGRGRSASAHGDEAAAHEHTLQAYNHLQQNGLTSFGNALADDTLKDMTGQLLANELEEEACALTSERIRTATSQRALNAARATLRELGRKDLAEEVETRLHENAREYLDRCAQLEKEGKRDEASLLLMQATHALPGNPHILINAAIALIRSLREQAWDLDTADRALTLLSQARQIDPDNGRATQLIRYLKQLARDHKSEIPPDTFPSAETTPANGTTSPAVPAVFFSRR